MTSLRTGKIPQTYKFREIVLVDTIGEKPLKSINQLNVPEGHYTEKFLGRRNILKEICVIMHLV